MKFSYLRTTIQVILICALLAGSSSIYAEEISESAPIVPVHEQISSEELPTDSQFESSINDPTVPADADIEVSGLTNSDLQNVEVETQNLASTTDPVIQTDDSVTNEAEPQSQSQASTSPLDVETGDNVGDVSATLSENATNTENVATTSDTLVADSSTVGDMAASFATTSDDYQSTTTVATSSVDYFAPATSTIVTGDAYAVTNVVNVVNVNVLDSQSLLAFLNTVSNGDNHFDLRSLALGFEGQIDCDTCEVSTSTLSSSTASVADSSSSSGAIGNTTSSTTASSTNTAVITNKVISRATTGQNSSVTAGDSNIITGGAYAVANVVNAVNANIIDSQYMFLALNSFGNWAGDLILPTASFFQNFLTRSSVPANYENSQIMVNATNTASVVNDVQATSSTGSNVATSSQNSDILTGSSYTASSIVNDINQNHVGDNLVALAFHVFGKWTGEAFNVPAGFQVVETADGVDLIGIFEADGSLVENMNIFVSASNTAIINNDLDISAETGNNTASSSNSLIVTGNAYSAANVLNIANTTSVGRNWLGAIFNIFGDWSGNVSFGQPDLWIAVKAEYPQGSGPGSVITYKYTLKNNGDAPAHDVKVINTLDSNYASFIDSSEVTFDVINPGEVKEFGYLASVSYELPYGDTAILNAIEVLGHETDADLSDNTDVITVVASRMRPVANYYVQTPFFEISKTASATSTIEASSTVDFYINLKNIGAQATSAVLLDRITDESGNVIHEEVWDLGAVNSNEEIKVSYTVLLSASTSGKYVNTAWVESMDSQFRPSGKSSVAVIVRDGEKYVLQEISGFEPQLVELEPVDGVQFRRASSAIAALNSAPTVLLPAEPQTISSSSDLVANALDSEKVRWSLYMLPFTLTIFGFSKGLRRIDEQ